MIKFAFKNILRYKLRSLLTLLVIIISAFLSVLSMGFYQGMIDLFLSGYIDFQTGHVRITTKEFLENQRFSPVYENITNQASLVKELEKHPKIKSVMPKIQFFGLLGNDSETVQGSVIALDLQNNSFNLEGNLLKGEIQQSGILMGEILRRKMDIQNPNDKIRIAGNTVEGGLNAIKEPVTGFYNYGMKLLDRQTVFLDLKNAQRLLRAGDSVTEILIFLHNENDTDIIEAELRQTYPNLAIESYKKQMGAMYSVLEIQKAVMGLITAFVMFLGSLIIVNSLLASIYERMSEIGMMKAIGFTDKELGVMFFCEGGIFGIVGGITGFIAGSGFTKYFSVHGMDLTAILADTNLPISATLYPEIGLFNAVISFVIVVFVPAIVALIPVHHIKKITPIKALNFIN